MKRNLLKWKRALAFLLCVLMITPNMLLYPAFAQEETPMHKQETAPDTAEPDTTEPDTAEPDAAPPDTAEPDEGLGGLSGKGLFSPLSGDMPFAVTIRWNDNKDTAGRTDVTLTILEGGVAMNPQPLTHELDKGDFEWTYTYLLPEGDEYSATASAVGYAAQAIDEEGSSFMLTKLMDLEIPLNWKDKSYSDTARPDFSAGDFVLYQDGTPLVDHAITADNTDSDNWLITATDLPMYDDSGTPYDYSLQLAAGKPAVADSALADEGVTYLLKYENFVNYAHLTDKAYPEGNITATLSGPTDFVGTKVWRDKDGAGADGPARPTGTLQLYRYTKGEDYTKGAPVPKMTMELDSIPYTGAPNIYEAAPLAETTIDFGALHEDLTGVPLARFDEDGAEYIYYVKEFLDGGGYEKEFSNAGEFQSVAGHNSYLFDGGTIHNRRVGSVTEKATKRWNSDANAGVSKTVTFVAEKKTGDDSEAWTQVQSETLTFTAEDMDKTASFGLPRYDIDGALIEYRVVEQAVTIGGKTAVRFEDDDPRGAGFEVRSESGTNIEHGDWYRSQKSGDIITNTLVGKIDLEIEKEWHPSAPESNPPLTFTIKRSGKDFAGNTVTMNSPYDALTIEGLEKYDATGKLYEYTVEEAPVAGYSTHIDYTFRDVEPHELENMIAKVSNYETGPGKSIYVKKNWLDDGDESSRRPVTVALFNAADNTQVEGYSLTLNKYGKWEGYIGLPADSDYTDYYVKEIAAGTAGSAFNYTDGDKTYSLTQGSATYYNKGTVAPNDSANPADGEVDGFLLTDAHVYKVETAKISDSSYTITNRRVGKVDIHLNKVWVDGENAKGHRPGSVTVKLTRSTLSKDTWTAAPDDVFGTVTFTLGSGNNWSDERLNLDKYDASGVLYNYHAEEVFDTDGTDYRKSDSREYQPSDAHRTGDKITFKFTNTLTGSIVPKITKLWLDGDPPRRPDIYLEVYARHEEPDIMGRGMGMRTMTEFVGRTATPFAAPTGKEKEQGYIEHRWDTSTNPGEWLCTFSSLPKYTGKGYEITYLVREIMPVRGEYITYYYDGDNEESYTEDIAALRGGDLDAAAPKADDNFVKMGGVIVNRLEAVRDIKGVKLWRNMGGTSTEYYPVVELELRHRKTPGAECEKVEHNASGAALLNPVTINNGAGSFQFLQVPKYDKLGSAILYRVWEKSINGQPVSTDGDNLGYDIKQPLDGNFTLTNTYTGGEKRSLTVNKQFTGVPADPEFEPTSIQVDVLRQMQNGSGTDIGDTLQKVPGSPFTIVITKSGGDYTGTFTTDLPTYAPNGYKYLYFAEEVQPGGYDTPIYTVSGGSPEATTEKVPLPEEVSVTVAIENTYTETTTQPTITISGTKVWNDQSDKYSTRPGAETALGKFSLHRVDKSITNPTELDWKHVTDAVFAWTSTTGDSWSFTVTGDTGVLLKYAPSGNEYLYQVREAAVNGYNNNNAISKDASGTGSTLAATLTNTLDTTSLAVTKVWQYTDGTDTQTITAGEDHFGMTQNITLQLERKLNGEDDSVFAPVNAYGDNIDGTATLTNASRNFTFSNLPKYNADGEEYIYRAREINIGGVNVAGNKAGAFTVSYSGNTITNTAGAVAIYVQTQWDDEDNQDGVRPKGATNISYTISDGTLSRTITQNHNNSTGVSTDKFLWNISGKTLVPKTTFDGEAKSYSVTQAAPDLYETVGKDKDGNPLTGDSANMVGADNATAHPTDTNGKLYSFVNTHTPATVTLSAKKAWVNHEQSGYQPGDVTVQLQSASVSNPTEADWGAVTDGTRTLSATGEWKADWNSLTLPARVNSSYQNVASTGTSRSISYRVKEDLTGSPDIYYTSVSSPAAVSAAATSGTAALGEITVTNTLKTIDITAQKSWTDSANNEARPDLVSVQLQRKTSADTVFSDVGTEQTLSEGSGWKYKWSNLPEFDTGGNKYTYKVVETTALPNYTAAYSPDNGELVASGTVTITNTVGLISHDVEKSWEGTGGSTGVSKVLVQLQRSLDGTDWTNYRAITEFPVTGGTFANLLQYDAGGTNTAYQYRAIEIGIKLTDGTVVDVIPDSDNPLTGQVGAWEYATAVEDGKTTITNTLLTIDSITAAKTWSDDDNTHGARPDLVSVQLQRKIDAGSFAGVGAAQNISAPDWNHTWSGLPEFDTRGNKYTYKVLEAPVANYETTYAPADATLTASGTVAITNTLRLREYDVEKSWVGGHTGVSKVFVKLQRLEGSSWTDVPGKTAELTAANDFKATFAELVEYESLGSAYQYRVIETEVELAGGDTVAALPADSASPLVGQVGQWGYATAVEDDKSTITNTLKTADISMQKIWVDSDDDYGTRPESVTVQLQRKLATEPNTAFANLGAAQNLSAPDWNHTWVDLHEFDELGSAYAYRVRETKIGDVDVDGTKAGAYTVSYNDSTHTITNTLNIRSYTVEKLWPDGFAGVDNILITLQRRVDGTDWEDYQTALQLAVTGDNFTGLPRYDAAGAQYHYRATETGIKLTDGTVVDVIPDSDNPLTGQVGAWEYATVVEDGKTTITNTLHKISLSGSKTWVDDSNYFGTRPTSSGVTLTVLADGAALSPQPWVDWTDTGSNIWSYSISGLPRYSPTGAAIAYSVTESADGYTSAPATALGTAEADGNITGADFVNTLDTFTISGRKIWNDTSDKYGLRPESLALTVLGDGNPIDPQPKPEQIIWSGTDGDIWSYTIFGLPKPASQAEAQTYTISEETVYAYQNTGLIKSGTAADSTFNLAIEDFTNTLKTGTLTVEKKIEWDAEDADSVEDTYNFSFQVYYKDFAEEWRLWKGDYTPKGDVPRTTCDRGIITIPGGKSVTLNDFTVGGFPAIAYKVVEIPHSAFTPSGDEGEDAGLTLDINPKANITNTYIRKLRIVNVTENPIDNQPRGSVGGTVSILESVNNQDKLDATSYEKNRMAVSWKPDEYYAFKDTFSIRYEELDAMSGAMVPHTVTVEGYLDENGDLRPKDDPVYNDLAAAYPSFTIEMDASGAIILTLAADKNGMPPITDVEVQFQPTLAVENTTAGDRGGTVQVIGGTANNSADGVGDKGNHNSRYPRNVVYGKALSGYRVDTANLTIGNPHTSAYDVGSNTSAVRLTPDASGNFSADVPTTVGGVDTTITVTGQVFYDEPSPPELYGDMGRRMMALGRGVLGAFPISAGRADSVRIVISGTSLPIPLDIGIPFVMTAVSGDSGPEDEGTESIPPKDKEGDFWKDVTEIVKEAKPGDTIKVIPGDYVNVPKSVIDEVRKNKGILIIETPKGPIVIPYDQLPDEPGRLYYPIEYLRYLVGIVRNPSTGGGAWEITAPGADVELGHSNGGGAWKITAPGPKPTISAPSADTTATRPAPQLERAMQLAAGACITAGLSAVGWSLRRRRNKKSAR